MVSSTEHKKRDSHKEETVNLRGHNVKKSDVVKLGGLLVFFLITIGIIVALWPSFSLFFEPDGLSKVVENIQGMGLMGVLALFALQFLQIIVAFIPGEVVEVAAGVIYGPVWGSLLLLLGCVFSSACVFTLVHKLGAPFVQSMISEKYMKKFSKFEDSNKLTIVVFILFLLPGMPKDVFTYLVSLTNMPMKTFLLVSNTARIPALVATTYVASGIAGDNLVGGIVVLVIALVITFFCVLFREKLFAALSISKKK